MTIKKWLLFLFFGTVLAVTGPRLAIAEADRFIVSATCEIHNNQKYLTNFSFAMSPMLFRRSHGNAALLQTAFQLVSKTRGVIPVALYDDILKPMFLELEGRPKVIHIERIDWRKCGITI